MNRYARLLIATVALAAYLLGLRYAAPADQPYFIVGIGIIAIAAWVSGAITGLISAAILIPLSGLIYKQLAVDSTFNGYLYSPAYLTLGLLIPLIIGSLRRDKEILKKRELELRESNARLKAVLSQVQELGGIHNMCGECKKIKTDEGDWKAIDAFLKEHTKIEFSHCICPECAEHFHEKN